METMPPPTIAAIATAPGQAGVAIVRLSGPQSWAVVQRLFSGGARLIPGQIAYGWIRDTAVEPAQPVDEVIVLPFRGPKSFTGEDVVEIHCHGGHLIPQLILQLCLRESAEPAGPGEFTRRAFVNGKLDLTQAEAIADLIAAEGEGLARAASHQLHGRGLAARIEQLRAAVLPVQAEIVASTDYPEEVDEPDRGLLARRLAEVYEQGQAISTASQHNRLLREGLKVAILGRPNAGKSSLFNALLVRERAIVTSIAGTTRDTLSETVTVAGVPLTLLDTAGIRHSVDEVERLGIERSWETARDAQAILYLVDATELAGLAPGQWPIEDTGHLAKLPAGIPCLMLATKADRLLDGVIRPDVQPLSTVTGVGMPALWQWLEIQVKAGLASAPQDRFVTMNHRQTRCLAEALEHLETARTVLAEPALPIDLVTVPLSEMLLALDALTGRDTTETVLTEVFHRFCVGK